MEPRISRFLAALVWAGGLAVSAQPTLTVANVAPIDGAQFTEWTGSASAPEGDGPDQFWDFSAFVVEEADTIQYEAALIDSAFGCALGFPYDIGGGDYCHVSVEGHLFERPTLSYPFGTLPVIHEGLSAVRLPMSYGDEIAGTHLYRLLAQGCGGSGVLEWPATLMRADAYGTALLPFGSYGPLLRVHMVADHPFDTTALSFERYRYFLPGCHHPLITLTKDLGTDTWEMRMLDPASVVALPEDPRIGGLLILKPQPVENVLFVQVPDDMQVATEVSIQDVTGRPVHQYAPTDIVHGLDVSDLSTGSYVLRVVCQGSRVLSSRFIKSDH